MYNVYVEDFMIRDVKYIWYNMSYRDLKKILRENKVLKVFPLVDKHGKVEPCIFRIRMNVWKSFNEYSLEYKQ